MYKAFYRSQRGNIQNRIWFNLNAKEEQLFYFNNKQILIIESGSFMTIRQNNQGKQIGVDILRPGDLLGILNFNAESPQDHILILPLTDCFRLSGFKNYF